MTRIVKIIYIYIYIMSNQANRIYNFYSARCGLGPEYFVDYLRGTACKKPLELYYKLYLDSNQQEPAFSVTRNLTQNNSYSGMVTTYGTDKTYTNFTQDLIMFNGIRNPGDTILPGVTIPPTYFEVITIQSPPYENNIIVGQNHYVDASSSLETSIDYLEFYVGEATGIYTGYSKIALYLNNTDNYTRKIVIT